MKESGQRHAADAFRLRNIYGTNSIGGYVGPRAGQGLSGKRKMCFLCRDLNTALPSPWSCTNCSHFCS